MNKCKHGVQHSGHYDCPDCLRDFYHRQKKKKDEALLEELKLQQAKLPKVKPSKEEN